MNMREGAITQHEMFLSYMQAGFTRAEALALVQTIVAATIAGDAK